MLLVPLMFALGIHLDGSLSPEASLGTLFNCITVTKLGSFVYFTFLYRSEAGILVTVAGWLICHAVPLVVMVRTLGQRYLLNHQLTSQQKALILQHLRHRLLTASLPKSQHQ